MGEPKKTRSWDALNLKWGGLLLLPLIAGFCWWSWRKWPDVLIDFGRELYIPWQLSCGKVLFRDLEQMYGPLSVYFNASLFRCFGVSYTILIFANLAIAAIFTWMIHRFFSQICSAFTAIVCGLTLIPLFLFAHNGFNGNYNFISPYSHEMVHGLVLSVAALMFLRLYHNAKKLSFLFAAGLVTGLVFLTKIEVFVALAAAETVFFLLLLFGERSKNWRPFINFMGAALLPSLLFFGYFLSTMSLQLAIKGIIGQWLVLLAHNPVGSGVYRFIMGTDQLWANLSDMLSYSAIFIAGAASSYWWCLQRVKTGRWRFAMGLLVVLLLNCGVFWGNFPTLACALPVLTLVSILLLGWDFSKRKGIAADKQMMLLAWGVFSLTLLLKIFFKCKFNHYGFVLTLPATLMIVSMLLYVLPERLKARGGNAMLFRLGMTAIIGVVAVRSILFTGHFYEIKTYEVGTEGDRMYTESSQISPRGMAVAGAVEWLKQHVRPEETVAVMPEGVMFNYLSRRSSSSRYTNFLPFEMTLNGEARMLRELKENPPDFCVIVHRTIREYGGGLWGRTTYGVSLMEWLNRDYQPVALIGFEPFQEEAAFGIKIMVAKNRKPQMFKPSSLRQP